MTAPNAYDRCLALVPDDVILSMATREFDMFWPESCICGWALREAVARLPEYANLEPEDVAYPLQKRAFGFDTTARACERAFGGNLADWNFMFLDVASLDPESAELAFMRRLDTAVEAST